MQFFDSTQAIKTCGTRYNFSAIEILERAFAQALHIQAFDIDICIDDFRFARERLTFGNQRTIFSNHQVTAKNHIRCRFVNACRCIHIGSHASCRLIQHKIPAVIAFTHESITCRQVYNYICTGKCKFTARRYRRPQVLAKFNANANFGTRAFAAVLTKRTTLYGKVICHRHFANAIEIATDCSNRAANGTTQQVATAREMAFLIEFTLVRQMNLGRHSNELAMLQERSTVVQAPEHPQRKPHGKNNIAIGKSTRDFQ